VVDDAGASGVHSGTMSAPPELYTAALERAWKHTRDWLADVPSRPVPPRTTADDLAAVLGGPLPDQPTDPGTVVDLLVAGVEPGLMAMPSGRFFGWVIGGTLPAALGADWLTSAWDQNAGMRFATPGVAAAEEAAGGWLLDLLGLPPEAAVGFTTGATMAGFTGLAAARQHVLAGAGWDVERLGLAGGPKVDVLVGAERHDSVDLALRYLGLGAPTPVAADDQGRVVPAALAAALAAVEGPTIVVLQAGNLHSGAYDPFRECISLAHDRGAWVHVDGAFGLWAAASPSLRYLVDGVEAADSWATDAHKTLNVPYDCGISVVAHPQPLQAAMSVRTSYLVRASDVPDPFDKVPELSRRARGLPVWAALRSLGRTGVASLVDRLAANARAIANGVTTVPGAEVLNDVVFTQVCVSFGDDASTRAVTERLLADGTAWMSGSRWHGRDVLRVSVSNWSTDEGDVDVSVDAVRRAALPLGPEGVRLPSAHA
jgi:glutamate/tyrosine decarboxylase-like PLP-dependent enzyme